MQQKQCHRNAERGFTLVEAMVVVAIAGILVGFGYAGFTKVLERQRYQGAVNRIAQVLKLAQMKAVEKHTSYFVRLNAANETLSITRDQDDNVSTSGVQSFEQINLGQEYRGIDVSQGANFRFDSRGMPRNPANNGWTAATIKLHPLNQAGDQGNVTISSMGRIRVALPEKWKY
jgi:prepilin-type N-terminal cleavage/methylation domain-containing protein